jgi:hypothetical protein
MYEYFENECEEQVKFDAAKIAEEQLNLNKLTVPAYYKDKNEHERTKKILEDVGYKSITLALGHKKFNSFPYGYEALKNLHKFCLANNKISPKLFDDTQLVVCTRLYHLVDAAIILKDIMSIRHKAAFELWLRRVYIPSCKYLTKSIVHRSSNHGAWGYLGLAMAYTYLNDQNALEGVSRGLKKHLKSIGKQPWYTRIFGKYTIGKAEFWVENIRTKSGLYYTYYHTIPLLKLYEVLFENGIPSNDILDTVEKLTTQIYMYASGIENWPFMKQSKIIGIKQLQQLIFPSAKTFRELTVGGKSSTLFERLDYIIGTDQYVDRYESSQPINQDGPYRHNSVRIELGL